MKLFITAIIVFMSCNVSVAEEAVLQVTEAWMRPTLLENRPSAVYFTIKNNTVKSDKLIKAVSMLANRIEFHTHKHGDGVMRMMKVKDIPVLGKSTVIVKPGGYHLMVFGLSMKYSLGDEFPLILEFANAGRIPVVAKVMKKAP